MKWSTKPPIYEKVSSEDDDWPSKSQTIHLSWRTKHFSLLNLGFFVINILFLITTLWSTSQQWSPNWQLKQLNSYTPLLDQFNFSISHQRLNASLFNDPYSIYKADPSPEVDAAWDDISDTPVLVISEEDVRSMGKDPDYATEVPLQFGYGSNKYFAVNDGQHLIHCLDELRKFAYYDYYYADKFGPIPNATNIPALPSAHRSHCLGVLLNALTCQPSMNMVLWEWVEGESAPYPDFSIDRKCINYDAFRGWMNNHQVSRQSIKEWKWDGGKGRGSGKKVRPLEEGWKKAKQQAKGKEGGHGVTLGHEHAHAHEHTD